MQLKDIGNNFSISKYRTPLMGFAMIWVMLFHLPISCSYLNPIKHLGYLGVDIFLFLSSYGLYYGFKKDNQCIKKFYKKRILRILPSYYFILVLVFCTNSILASKCELKTLFQEATFLGFFFPQLHLPVFLWYILYFIFPIIYQRLYLFKKNSCLLGIVLFVFCINYIMSTYYLKNNLINNNFLLIFIPRIIPFVCGIVWANTEKYKFNKTNILISFLIGIICLLSIYLSKKFLPDYYRLPFMLEYMPFIFALPFCIFSCAILFEYSPIFIQKIISYAGKYSLELYLIHESLYTYTFKIAHYYQLNSYYIFPFTLLICFILAYCLNFTIKHILALNK